MLNPMGFVVGRLLAERAGVTDAAAINRLGLLNSALGLTPVGVVATRQLAEREAPPAPAKPPVAVKPAGADDAADRVSKKVADRMTEVFQKPLEDLAGAHRSQEQALGRIEKLLKEIGAEYRSQRQVLQKVARRLAGRGPK